MIQQAETSLTVDEYNALRDAYGDPVARVTLEQYSLSLTAKAGGGAGGDNTCFDAIVVNDVVVRAWGTADTITVEALASEDTGDESWADQNLTATNLVTAAGLTLAASSDAVRVFWWDGTTLKYFESTDKGATWGAAQTVYTKSNVHMIAATSLTRLHVISETSGANYRFHSIDYDGSWAETDSDIYWPFLPGSFDAIATGCLDDGAAAVPDILAFSTDFPPMIKVGIENTVLTRDYERVRGIAVIRYQNGRWSDHYHLDVVDNLYAASEREYVRLSNYGDLLFLTYQRIDGDADYSHTSVAISRSRTGIHWEQPYLLGDIAGPPAILLKRGAHAYVLGAEDAWRSPSVGYTGDSHVTQDVTSRVTSLTARMGDIQEIQIALANGDNVLDNTSPLGDDVAIQAVIEEGWVVNGTPLLIHTAVVDIDNISQSLTMPTNHKILTGRDVLARLLTANADCVQEWPSQQVSGDNFQGTDSTKYSGLRHTAAMLGHWETEDNVLKLSSNKVPGVALHTGVSNAWNGTARAKCRTQASDSADYVGLVFRAYDQENLWYVVYDADADKIKLVERRNSVDTLKTQTAAMGWLHNTFYGLQANFRYNKIDVYSSTDFANYLLQLSYTPPGVSVPGSVWGDLPTMEGSMGYLGFGYSEEQTGGYPPLPSYTPWPSDPYIDASTPYDWPNEVYVGTWAMGIYHTLDFTDIDDPDQPSWTSVNAGLPSTEVSGDTRYYVRQLLLDPLHPRARQYCQVGTPANPGSIYRREYRGTWEEILTYVEACTLTNVYGGRIYWIGVNKLISSKYDGHLYALVGQELDPPSLGAVEFLKSTDYGNTWTHAGTPKDPSTAIVYSIGNIVAYGEYIFASWNRGTGGGQGRISRSTSCGSGWIASDIIGGSDWIPQLSLNPFTYANVYTNTNKLVIGEFELGVLPAAESEITILQAGLEIGPERTDAMWFSANLPDYQRLVRDNKLYVTTDGWQSVENPAPDVFSETYVGTLRAPVELDESKIILGRTTVAEANPEHLLVIDDETETDLVSKSGIDPENELTVVSIPWTGGGICYEGLQPVIWP